MTQINSPHRDFLEAENKMLKQKVRAMSQMTVCCKSAINTERHFKGQNVFVDDHTTSTVPFILHMRAQSGAQSAMCLWFNQLKQEDDFVFLTAT